MAAFQYQSVFFSSTESMAFLESDCFAVDGPSFTSLIHLIDRAFPFFSPQSVILFGIQASQGWLWLRFYEH
jgi:hypothetical protein